MAQKMALSKKQKQGRMIIIASLILLVVIAIFTFTLMEKPQITKEADNKKYKEAYKEDITISYIAPLSGDAGIWGQSLKKGFDFALQEYNKNPDSKYQLKVIYEDDGCDPTMGVNIFNIL